MGKQPALVRERHGFTTPGEIREILKRRLKALQFTMREYLLSLVAYDLWAERNHLLTGDYIRAGGEQEWEMWQRIAANFGKPPSEKAGFFFEQAVRRTLVGDIENKDTQGFAAAVTILAHEFAVARANEAARGITGKPATTEAIVRYEAEHWAELEAQAIEAVRALMKIGRSTKRERL